MKTPVILLVDDEDSIVNSLRGGLEDDGYIVLTASDGKRALDIIKAQPVSMIFLDIWLPEMDGLTALKAIKEFDADIEVVIMTGHGNVNTAVQAVKQGAFDFLEKPFSLDTVLDLTRKVKEKQAVARLKRAQEVSDDEVNKLLLTGEAPAILNIKEQIIKIAQTDEHLLITGEAGTGKELVARMVHKSSPQAAGQFVKFNCAFYASEEAETELFGLHRDRKEQAKKPGLLLIASNCTVLLDGLNALASRVQKKVAKCISAAALKKSGARVIGTIIKDPQSAKEARMIHSSLEESFGRSISMPELRNRRADIPLLLNLFISYFCKEYDIREKSLEADALDALMNYDWPGNVKELKNLAEKLVISVPTRTIGNHDIPPSIRDEMQSSMAQYYERYKSMAEAEAAWRKNYVLYHLRKHDRNMKATSRRLQIQERLLRKYIQDYSIVVSGEKRGQNKHQRTLKRSMVLGGRGLHSGDKTGLILTPLPADSGIVFGNISSGDTVPANIDYVVSTAYATCLQNTNAMARTIEHLLATLHAYRITNLMIKINNEVPIMDGSSLDFCQLIEDAGVEEQGAMLEEIVIRERMVVGDATQQGKYIMIEPDDKFSIFYTLHYPKPVGLQQYHFVLDDTESFKRDIAPARTFGFVKDIEALERQGLGGGGRLNNFILIDDEKIVNTDLRFADEFVRHKILDMMGDLYLLGRPIRGKVTANMTGHTENIEFMRMLRDRITP